jgi:hypothetical protein
MPTAAIGDDSRELAILKTIAEALNAAGDVDQALRTTLEQVAALLGLETGGIWACRPADRRPCSRAKPGAARCRRRDDYDEARRSGYLWHEFGDAHLVLGVRS